MTRLTRINSNAPINCNAEPTANAGPSDFAPRLGSNPSLIKPINKGPMVPPALKLRLNNAADVDLMFVGASA